jgi:hypothetical protein
MHGRVNGILFPAAFLLLLVARHQAIAAPILVPGHNITVDGTATLNGAVWEYRYVIADVLGVGPVVNPVRFILSEHATHAGLHDEFNIQADGGNFVRDFPVPPPFVGIAAHNYFWDALALPPRGRITVGFDDEHAPSLAAWGLDSPRGVPHIEQDMLLPVPSRVPEPGTLTLMALGAVGILRRAWRRRS